MVYRSLALILVVFLIACRSEAPGQQLAPGASSDSGRPPMASAGPANWKGREAAAQPGSPTSTQVEADVGDPEQAQRLEAFRRWFSLSTPGEKFISDNVVSNETCLPQTAAALSRLRGGVYFGVGPEQNFDLIAWSHPRLAFIVDLRRDNALLHLLYKALFESSGSRLEFLSSLLGRPTVSSQSRTEAGADAVIGLAERAAPDREWFESQHRKLAERIRGYGLGLSAKDFERIHHFHRLFFERQLELHFEMHTPNARNYPALRELLTSRSDEGIGTFLDTEAAFHDVRVMQREHRIIPVVGDVGAEQPLGALAHELSDRQLELSVYYISNVEQYLIGTPSFSGWLRNLALLTQGDQSVILRVFLDQGRPHPRQRAGQRSTPVLHQIAPFLAKSKRKAYASYFALVTDDSLLATPGGTGDGLRQSPGR